MPATIFFSRTTRPWLSLLAALVLVSPATHAQEQPDQPTALTEESRERFDGLLSEIDATRAEAATLSARIPRTTGPLVDLLDFRLEQDRLKLLERGVSLGQAVVDAESSGFDVADFKAQAIAVLQTHPDIFEAAWDADQRAGLLPAADLSASEQAAAYDEFFERIRNLDRMIALTGDTYRLLNELGAPATDLETQFENRLVDRAVTASVFLQLMQRRADKVRASLNVLPDDTELKARLAVAKDAVTMTAAALDRLADELAARNYDVADYREQVVTATGAVTSGALDVSVLKSLFSGWGQRTVDAVIDRGPTFVLRLLVVAIIVVVFVRAARVSRRIMEHTLNRSHAALSQLLKRTIVATVGNLVLALGALIALSQVGISLVPVLAGLGIAGIAVGLALQDSLSNFASGVMILFSRPYDVGDLVEVGGVLGEVKHMSLVNTTIHTLDNQRIIIPNSAVWGGVIKNVTSQKIRRVDMTFGISYSDDIPKTERILKEIVEAHDLVLDEPEPNIRLHELADSSVNFIVRPWAKREDYWHVYWDITRAVKMRFDEEHITIPFPQRDVHLSAEGAAQSVAAHSSKPKGARTG